MPLEDILASAATTTEPAPGAKERVRAAVFQRIATEAALEQNIAPATAEQKARIWRNIVDRLQPMPSTILETLQQALAPAPGLASFLRAKILGELVPVPAFNWGTTGLRWTAAVAVIALSIRVSPWIILAPQTQADTHVQATATVGTFAYSTDSERWHTGADVLKVEPGTRISTGNGQEVSVVFHDNAVLRLAQNTTVLFQDTTERGEKGTSPIVATLERGTLWLQGLLPPTMPGFTVAANGGQVTVHEGSASLSLEGSPTVTAYDRTVGMVIGGTAVTIAAGETADLAQGARAKEIAAAQFTASWPSQNLTRDASHRHEIAELQKQRRIAMAGILPTSSFYSVKRAAETMDVLMTLDPDTKLEKQLQNANTRLNEAVALLDEEQPEAAAAQLKEFKDTVVSLSEAAGDDSAAQDEVAHAVVAQAADVAAVLPTDPTYAAKQVALETAAAVGSGSITTEVLEHTLLADALTALTDAVGSGSIADVTDHWQDLEPSLNLLDRETDLSLGERKEVRSLLQRLATAVDDRHAELAASGANVLAELEDYLPSEEAPVVASMTDEEVDAAAEGIMNRVFDYRMPRSRSNQLTTELRKLATHPDAGRILRSLYRRMPPDSDLTQMVRRSIQQLRWATAAEAE